MGRTCGSCPVRAALCTPPRRNSPISAPPLRECFARNCPPSFRARWAGRPVGSAPRVLTRENWVSVFRRFPTRTRAPSPVSSFLVPWTPTPGAAARFPRCLTQHGFNAQRCARASIPQVSELAAGPNTPVEQALRSDLPKSRAARIDAEKLREPGGETAEGEHPPSLCHSLRERLPY